MKSKYLLLFAFIFLIGIISAVIPVYEKCSEINLNHPVRLDDFPDANILCNITTFFPNNTISTNFKIMTNNYDQHNYTINSTQTCILGRHTYDMTCTNGASNKTESFEFEITPTGEELTIAKGIVYIFLSALIFLLFLFVLYVNIALPMGNEKNNRGQTIKIIKKKYIKIALIPVTYSLFVWFLNLLLSISNNLTGRFNIYSELIGFLFTFFLRLSWAVWIVCFVWFMFNWIRDLNWNKQIKKFGKVIR